MWTVFVILWVATLLVGLGATGYGLYQMLEEPLQSWRKKPVEPDKESDVDAAAVEDALHTEGAEELEDAESGATLSEEGIEEDDFEVEDEIEDEIEDVEAEFDDEEAEEDEDVIEFDEEDEEELK